MFGRELYAPVYKQDIFLGRISGTVCLKKLTAEASLTGNKLASAVSFIRRKVLLLLGRLLVGRQLHVRVFVGFRHQLLNFLPAGEVGIHGQQLLP